MRVLVDGHDGEGNLILVNGQLAAVIVRLDGDHHNLDHKGSWYLEVGFGRCDVRIAPPVFATLEEAGAKVKQILTRKAA
jgi:hypothetical protein